MEEKERRREIDGRKKTQSTATERKQMLLLLVDGVSGIGFSTNVRWEDLSSCGIKSFRIPEKTFKKIALFIAQLSRSFSCRLSNYMFPFGPWELTRTTPRQFVKRRKSLLLEIENLSSFRPREIRSASINNLRLCVIQIGLHHKSSRLSISSWIIKKLSERRYPIGTDYETSSV